MRELLERRKLRARAELVDGAVESGAEEVDGHEVDLLDRRRRARVDADRVAHEIDERPAKRGEVVAPARYVRPVRACSGEHERLALEQVGVRLERGVRDPIP